MKKTITLYHVIESDEVLTEYDAEMLYDNMIYDSYAESTPCNYNSFPAFLDHMLFTGQWEEITAYLSSSKTVYPYYYIEDDIGVVTVLQHYMAWQSMPYMDRMQNIPTFAEFLNIPQEDRNGVMAYGFYK